jgi:Major Facilitator Superfamily
LGQSASRGGFIGSGFLRTLVLRLLTSSLLIVIPLFLSKSLRVPDEYIGVYILLLWLGNAVGVLASITVLKRQSLSSLLGFGLLVFSLLGMALSVSNHVMVAISDLAAGVGMGMAQPFLAALMHLDAGRKNPYRGIGLYSVALGVGLVLGPLLPYGLLILGGFFAVFLTLSAVAAFGLAEVVVRIFDAGPLSAEKAEYSLSLTQWVSAFKSKGFAQAFSVNFLYSLLLPIILSYGGVYGENRFGISPSTALLVFTAIFLVSTVVRSVALLFRHSTRFSLLVSGVFLAGSFLAIGAAPSFLVFLLGMLAFSIPHALLLPATNYKALTSVENHIVMNASYAFQASSGVAEFVSPAIAVGVISWFGIASIFSIMAPIALLVLCMVAVPYLRKQ